MTLILRLSQPHEPFPGKPKGRIPLCHSEAEPDLPAFPSLQRLKVLTQMGVGRGE